MIKIQVIDIAKNQLVDEIKDSNDIKFMPRVDEIISNKHGPWLVKGVAHLWDDQLIKIMVQSALQNKPTE